MKTRIEELCNRPVITPPRDLESEPISRQEILDCLLLTAVFEKERLPEIYMAMVVLAALTRGRDEHSQEALAEAKSLRELPEDRPTLLTDYVDLDDRLPEMTVAWEALRDIADYYPAQAEYLNAAAGIMESYWPPLTPEE